MQDTPFIWRPGDHAWTAESHVARFMHRHGFTSISELRRASVRDIDWFWREAVIDLDLEWERPFSRISDRSKGFPWTQWFVDGRINITHNCIGRHVRDGHGEETALFYESDSGNSDESLRLSYGELSQRIDRCAGALKASGLTAGDCVALYAPMQIPTVVVLFAAMKIGARFVPIFCGYGQEALRERLELCEAKILFACGRLVRRGKATDTRSIAEAAADSVASIRRVVWTDTEDWKQFLQIPLTPALSPGERAGVRGNRHHPRQRPLRQLAPRSLA